MDSKIIYIDIETVIECDPADRVNYSKRHVWEERYCGGIDSDDTVDFTNAPIEDWYRTRGSLFPEFAKVICISVGSWEKVDDGVAFRTQSFYSRDNERKLLLDFSTWLASQGEFRLCGHNIKQFDLPFMYRRLVINGVKPHNLINNADKKPWEIPHIDTKDLWKGGGGSNAGLEIIALCLGLPSPKQEMSGKDIVSIFYGPRLDDGSGGDPVMEQIAKYCEGDVRTTAQVYRRIVDVRPQLTEEILKEMSGKETTKTLDTLTKEIYDTYRVPLGRDDKVRNAVLDMSMRKPTFTADLLEKLCEKVRIGERQYDTVEDLFNVIRQHYTIPEEMEATITRKYEDAQKVHLARLRDEHEKKEINDLDAILGDGNPLA